MRSLNYKTLTLLTQETKLTVLLELGMDFLNFELLHNKIHKGTRFSWP